MRTNARIYPAILTAAVFAAIVTCHGGGRIDTGSCGFVVTGKVYFSGSDPMNRVVFIADTSGVHWIVDNFEASAELYRLAGLRVTVSAEIRGRDDKGVRIFARRYRLLPPPGSSAACGILMDLSGRVALGRPGTRERLVLAGPLASVLRSFIGRRAWVSGETEQGNVGGCGWVDIGVEAGPGVSSSSDALFDEANRVTRRHAPIAADTMTVRAYWIL